MITCEQCRYFKPDPDNPTAGMGECQADARHGFFFPAELHRCRDFIESAPPQEQDPPADG